MNIADYRYMGFLLAYKENKCLKGQASAAEVAAAEAAWGITLPLALKEQMMLTALRIILPGVRRSSNEGGGKKVADESSSDGKTPLLIQWLTSDYVDVPVKFSAPAQKQTAF
ncbi:hypothetical protein HNQ91_001807 [Filimonas zeae]|uniref:hypothetical protein n=1 Tax=Filimonas zeae TaxID=1737353 RepID=UPI00285FD557|nr:hypothetical protein [Filimonas zeae]MDR6338756.1 hypothetical protein [Filimonas zeae]